MTKKFSELRDRMSPERREKNQEAAQQVLDGIGHLWVCKGCLIRHGQDPDRVVESCIGRHGKHTCDFCGHIQDGSWFRHMLPCDLPQGLQEELKSELRRGT